MSAQFNLLSFILGMFIDRVLSPLLESLVHPKLSCEVRLRFFNYPDFYSLITQDGTLYLKCAYQCYVKVTSNHSLILYFFRKQRTLTQLKATLRIGYTKESAGAFAIVNEEFPSVITRMEEPPERLDGLPSESYVDCLHVGDSCYTAYFLIDPITHTTFVPNPDHGEYQKIRGVPQKFWLKLTALHDRGYQFELHLPDVSIECLNA